MPFFPFFFFFFFFSFFSFLSFSSISFSSTLFLTASPNKILSPPRVSYKLKTSSNFNIQFFQFFYCLIKLMICNYFFIPTIFFINQDNKQFNIIFYFKSSLIPTRLLEINFLTVEDKINSLKKLFSLTQKYSSILFFSHLLFAF